jgi:phasin family protein
LLSLGLLEPWKTDLVAILKEDHAMELVPSPANLLGQIASTFEQFRLPGLNARALLDGRRKDIEALAEANRIALDGLQELARKQGQILQETVQELQTLVREVPASLVQDPTKVGGLMQKVLQEAFGNVRDLAELARKSQTDAFQVVSKRVQHNIEELQASLESSKVGKSGQDA